MLGIIKAVTFALIALGLMSVSCGGGNGGRETRELTSGGVTFEVDFRGAEPTGDDEEVRRPPTMELATAPDGTEWWSFELRVENVGDQPAHTPDVAVICGSQSISEAEFFDDPGFVVGEPPYVRGSGAGGELDSGSSNTGVVPLAVPVEAEDCRFLVKMDEQIDGGLQPLEFSFQASR